MFARGGVLWLIFPVLAVASLAGAQETFELTPEGFRQLSAPVPGTPEAGLQAVRRALAEKKGPEAVKLADAWIAAHPHHELAPEAYLLRGDAKVIQIHYFEALFDYEHLIRHYPQSPQFQVALERELEIARAFGHGLRRRFLGMQILSAYDEAEELLIRIQERLPGSRLAEQAAIELGDMYYRRREMEKAADMYDLFLGTFPDSQWRQHATVRLVMASIAAFKGPLFDATGLIEARQRLVELERRYPAAADELGSKALDHRMDESLAQRSLLVAKWYEKRGQLVGARFMYKRVIQEHPASSAAVEAVRRLEVLEPENFAPGAASGPEGAP